jgi:putative transposase
VLTWTVGEGVRYRHWKNLGQACDCVFVTTTCLDFVHAFDRDDIRDAMCGTILGQCAKGGAKLSAFVVMPHHVHLLLKLGERQCVTDFMRDFKRRSSSVVRPMLSDSKVRQFDMQRGLNRNTFWQRSFRSVVVLSESVFLQKVRYIHENPVRAELVAVPEDYRWSSAWMWHRGLFDPEAGLPLDLAWPRMIPQEL